MGNNLQIKNHQYEVTMDTQTNHSLICFRVKDRKDFKNDKFIHTKRLKHFDLPIQIRKKFKNIKQFYQWILNNPDKVQIGQKQDVLVDIGVQKEQKISIPFQNINDNSIIFNEQENLEMEYRKQQMQKTIFGNGISINLGSNNQKSISIGSKQGQISNQSNSQQNQQAKQSIRKVLIRIIKKKNSLLQPNLNHLNTAQLASRLQQQWNQFQNAHYQPPLTNMIKKKFSNHPQQANKIPNQQTKNNSPSRNNSIQFQRLNNQVKRLQRQVQKISMKYEMYKQEINLQKFNQICRKNQESTKQKVLDQFLADISVRFNKSSNNSSSIQIQIKTKQALFSKIDNLINQLQKFRNQRRKQSPMKLHAGIDMAATLPEQNHSYTDSEVFKPPEGGDHLNEQERKNMEQNIKF